MGDDEYRYPTPGEHWVIDGVCLCGACRLASQPAEPGPTTPVPLGNPALPPGQPGACPTHPESPTCPRPDLPDATCGPRL
jgi:hypothetical protein